MKALLSPNRELHNWFRRDFPEVQIFEQVQPEILKSETIIISALNIIDDQIYDIFPVWHRWLKLKHKNKKLLLLGWRKDENRLSNYRNIHDLTSVTNWEHSAIPLQEKPHYPPSVDTNILEQIDTVLKSHVNNNFRDRLPIAWKSVKKLELELENIVQTDEVLKGQYAEDVRMTFNRLHALWEKALPFFSLLPEFYDLKHYQVIEEKAIDLLKNGTRNNPYFYKEIISYLNTSIKQIIDFYQLDQP